LSESLKSALPFRVASRDSIHLMGVEDVATPKDGDKIAALWKRFMVRHVEIPHAINQPPLALARVLGPDDRFDYLCAIQMTEPAPPPEGMIQRSLPPAEYAVFRHAGPVTTIAQTYARIFDNWPLERGFRKPPIFLELFLPKFDPATGEGGVEIWVMLEHAR
jgi:AraC family transcriptional regulator